MDEQAEIHIGRVRMKPVQAREYVSEYTQTGPDPKVKKPSAFPAHDLLQTGTGAEELNDGDLPAPAMLNVKVSIRALYGLQHIRAEVERALGSSVFEKSLANASDDEITAAIEPLYSPLDRPDRPDRPQDIGVTKFSKVMSTTGEY